MLDVWKVNVHNIKFTIDIVLGAPPQVLTILIDIVFGFLNAPVFKVGKYLKINFVGVPSFSDGEGLGTVSSSYLYG